MCKIIKPWTKNWFGTQLRHRLRDLILPLLIVFSISKTQFHHLRKLINGCLLQARVIARVRTVLVKNARKKGTELQIANETNKTSQKNQANHMWVKHEPM